jgi:hypothetical protein
LEKEKEKRKKGMGGKTMNGSILSYYKNKKRFRDNKKVCAYLIKERKVVQAHHTQLKKCYQNCFGHIHVK